MPVYVYRCKCGWSGNRQTAVDERDNQNCTRCGAVLERLFVPCRTILIPPYMQAGHMGKLANPLPATSEGMKSWQSDEGFSVRRARDL
jgi:hypothetical protein